MIDLVELQNQIETDFKDVSFLEQAFVHRSYLNENPGFGLLSNERLEFLGDAVLGLAVAEKLYLDFPDLPEGDLTKIRANLVSRETLGRIAESMELGKYIYLSHGEMKSGGLHRVSVLACTLEALIGAVFLDKGYIIARNYALVLLKNDLQQAFSGLQNADYKSLLQELTQARFKVTPVYRTVSAKGKEHDKEFSVAVYLGEMIIGRGNGKSKQASEKEAARAALEFLNKEPYPV